MTNVLALALVGVLCALPRSQPSHPQPTRTPDGSREHSWAVVSGTDLLGVAEQRSLQADSLSAGDLWLGNWILLPPALLAEAALGVLAGRSRVL